MAQAKTIEVKPYPKKGYAEEYQVTGFHYAFMSPDNKMCHHWVKCRDFLQDALRNQLTGRKDSIWGFTWVPGKDPEIETSRTLMLVKRMPDPDPKDDKSKKDFDEMMKSALKLVNHYEKKHKLTPRSKIVKVKMAGQYPYLFTGPGVWSQGPVMIAIYTFLIRIGHFKPTFKDEKSLQEAYDKIVKGQKQTNDTRYLKIVRKNLHKAIEHRDKHLFKPENWKKGDKVLFHDSQMGGFHHRSGIVSLSQFNTPIKELNDEFRKIFGGNK
jgi:hypothetical protein